MKYDLDMTIADILSDQDALSVFSRMLPDVLERIGKNPQTANLSIRKLAAYTHGMIPEQALCRLEGELQKIGAEKGWLSDAERERVAAYRQLSEQVNAHAAEKRKRPERLVRDSFIPGQPWFDTEASFTYGFAIEGDPESWQDDVVFPSGGSDPVYISDWEWMFDIFQKAIQAQNIQDGYCISLCYKGYSEDGALFNAFGGGAPMWYRNRAGEADFGGMDESMRTYLECMNTWYKNGWLDKAFAERTGDQVYNIDPAGVCSGKVGMWNGRRAQTGNQLDLGDELTSGIMVYGARYPINDLYGSEAVRGQEPYCLYQYSRLQHQVVVSNKVSEEDLPTVLAFIDYLYTLDGACVETFGLTKEQFDTMQDTSYIKYGLTDGAYYVEKNEDGTNRYVVVDALVADNNLCQAMAGKRITVGYKAEGFIPALNASYPVTMQNALKEWDYYLNTGFPDSTLRAGFTAEESAAYSKVHANVDTYMSTQIPKFIRGDLNIHSDGDWNDYCKILKRYGADQVTKAYQRLYDEMD